MQTRLGIGLVSFSLAGGLLAIGGHIQKQFPSWFDGLADGMWKMQMPHFAFRLTPTDDPLSEQMVLLCCLMVLREATAHPPAARIQTSCQRSRQILRPHVAPSGGPCNSARSCSALQWPYWRPVELT